MSKKALLALSIAILLPLVSYFLVKSYSDDAVVMPARYYADSVIEKVTDGKETTDTVWHKVENITLTNQMGHEVSLESTKRQGNRSRFFLYKMPIDLSHTHSEYEEAAGCAESER